MTDSEKLELIRKIVLNISPIDFTDEKIGLGAAHALCIAIELIVAAKPLPEPQKGE
jgi:hypothetical protein